MRVARSRQQAAGSALFCSDSGMVWLVAPVDRSIPLPIARQAATYVVQEGGWHDQNFIGKQAVTWQGEAASDNPPASTPPPLDSMAGPLTGSWGMMVLLCQQRVTRERVTSSFQLDAMLDAMRWSI
eukprot:jgi/Ulvmu1/896/UM101_0004.1